jgi:hypothetical protein
MNIIALLIMSCLIGGCTSRYDAQNEPDVEFILSQYDNQDPAVVDARRIREGW